MFYLRFGVGVISDVFDKLADAVDGFIGILQAIFSDDGIISIFYTEVSGLTFVGALLLIGLAYTLTKWAFNWVKNLVAMRMAK